MRDNGTDTTENLNRRQTVAATVTSQISQAFAGLGVRYTHATAEASYDRARCL